MAIVLEESGGMDCIINLRDRIEELVRALNENESPADIVQLGDNKWRIQGLTELDDVARTMGVSLPLDEYDTFSGYIFGILGQVPKASGQFELDTPVLHIVVESVRDHRVDTAIASVIA